MLQTSKHKYWPSGAYQTVAHVMLSEQQVSSITQQPFYTGNEPERGEWEAVGGELSDGSVVELLRYIGSKQPSYFEIRIDKAADSLTTTQAIFRELDIPESAIQWFYKEDKQP